MMSLTAKIWELGYGKWRTQTARPTPGYALLLPMPGDLPFFFNIFSRVFAGKQAEHLVETLVLPDCVPRGFRARFDRLAATWPHGPIRLVPFRRFDQILANQAHNPGAYHWLQLIHGVENTRASHAMLHDADAFITSPDFYETRYAECLRRNLVCFGVNPAWDHWFAAQGLGHVTATWELLFEIAWLKQYPPWVHRGHEHDWNGTPHVFDTTLYAQSLTSPDRIDRQDDATAYIHFSYVISTYRFFQKGKGSFEDEWFRLLLIRLLIDAFDPGDHPYDAPALAELERGLTDNSARVTYRTSKTASQYSTFRSNLQRLLDSPILEEFQRSSIETEVKPFDRAFG